jgi:hypothetical protein
MVVKLRIEVPDDYRKAIRHRLGDGGKATRKDVARHISMLIHADVVDACHEWRKYTSHRRGGGS